VNAPLKWGGATWISYAWEDLVNAAPQRRNEIMLHEMFHGVQAQPGVEDSLLVPVRGNNNINLNQTARLSYKDPG
jgi:hypothetical protein